MKEYQICNKCVMDTSDPKITFDSQGFCNHCNTYFAQKDGVLKSESSLRKIFDRIISEHSPSKFDALLGISGGTDSSMVAYLAWKAGLNVYLVHLDNCWDTKESLENIHNIVQTTGWTFKTVAVDWDEFKDLQLAYLRASVINAETPTDLGIAAVIYQQARRNRVKIILNGSNYVTEAIMPSSWGYRNDDVTNLRDVYSIYGNGTKKLKAFPMMSLAKLHFWYALCCNIKCLSPLNYIDYKLSEARKLLSKAFGWVDYGLKHYESIYTRFFQGYILPIKFNVDKRRAHLSTLICSLQMMREQALKELEKPPYDLKQLEKDKKYILEKLELSEEEFSNIMSLPIRKHTEFKTDWILKFRGLKHL